MITYEQVKEAMFNPPPEPFVDLFNEIGVLISDHKSCVNDKNPFEKLNQSGNFCISATSIQSKYIAFVLGKHKNSAFPSDVMSLFFDIESEFRIQFGRISGKEIDGCIYLIHQQGEDYNLQEIYQSIYA